MSVSLGSLISREISVPSSLSAPIELDDELTVTSDFAPITGNNKIQRAVVTCFPPDNDPKWLLPSTYYDDTSVISNWCGQFEMTPETDVLHFHLFIDFVHDKKPRFNSLRRVFAKHFDSTINIVIPKHRASNKGRDCSVNYVLAPSKRAPNTEPFIWEHNKNKLAFNESLWKDRAGKTDRASKEDRDKQIVDYIESKPRHWTWEQIVHETYESKLLLASCSWGSKFQAGRFAEQPRREIANVIILYGAGGTGKTTIAQKWDARDDEDYAERYYKRNYDDGKFWGGGRTGYKCQRIIHLEEFCGQESCSKFKELCDIGKEGPSVNIKNGGVQLNHETILITSNHHPAGWYRHLCQSDPKQWIPIARRFTQLWFFPAHRADGSLNIPDETHPPYYVDQTEEFRDLVYDYDAATDHANEHWPLREDHFVNGECQANGFRDPKTPRLS